MKMRTHITALIAASNWGMWYHTKSAFIFGCATLTTFLFLFLLIEGVNS